MPEQQISAEQIKKKSKKGIIIVVLAIILAVALGLAAGRYFNANKQTDEERMPADRLAGRDKESETLTAPANQPASNSTSSSNPSSQPPANQNPASPNQNPSTQPSSTPAEPAPAEPVPVDNLAVYYPKTDNEVGPTFDVTGHSKLFGDTLVGKEIRVSVQAGGVSYFNETVLPYSPYGPGALEAGLWGDFHKKVILSGSLTNGQALILYVFYYDPVAKIVSDSVSVPLKYKDPNALPMMTPLPGQQVVQPGMVINSTTFDPVLLPVQLNP